MRYFLSPYPSAFFEVPFEGAPLGLNKCDSKNFDPQWRGGEGGASATIHAPSCSRSVAFRSCDRNGSSELALFDQLQESLATVGTVVRLVTEAVSNQTDRTQFPRQSHIGEDRCRIPIVLRKSLTLPLAQGIGDAELQSVSSAERSNAVDLAQNAKFDTFRRSPILTATHPA